MWKHEMPLKVNSPFFPPANTSLIFSPISTSSSSSSSSICLLIRRLLRPWRLWYRRQWRRRRRARGRRAVRPHTTRGSPTGGALCRSRELGRTAASRAVCARPRGARRRQEGRGHGRGRAAVPSRLQSPAATESGDCLIVPGHTSPISPVPNVLARQGGRRAG